MPVETSGDGRANDTQKPGGAVEALLQIASKACFFRSEDGRFHADVPVGDRHEIYGLKSTAFGDWLIESYRCERGELPAADSVRCVIKSLVARARFERGMPAVHVRVGRAGGSVASDFYIDLGDSNGRAVKIRRGDGSWWINRR